VDLCPWHEVLFATAYATGLLQTLSKRKRVWQRGLPQSETDRHVQGSMPSPPLYVTLVPLYDSVGWYLDPKLWFKQDYVKTKKKPGSVTTDEFWRP
jgi:hypothetical protein